MPTFRVQYARQASNLFEPDYLAVSECGQILQHKMFYCDLFLHFLLHQEMKPKHPVYPCVNIQIKGYDFPILESYQRFLHRTAESLDLDVTDR